MRGMIFALSMLACRLCLRVAKLVDSNAYGDGERLSYEQVAGDCCSAPGCLHTGVWNVNGVLLCAMDFELMRARIRRRVAATGALSHADIMREVMELEQDCDHAESN